jgi:hypothetical protein
VHCEKLGKLLHEETEIHVLSFTLQSVCNWHLADVGVLVHVRFAPTAAVQSVLQSTILSSFANNIGIIRQLRRSHHVINSDNVFGTHTWLARGRTMISFTSTSSGCSIADYMIRPMASG